MANLIRVFICYKKQMSRQRDGQTFVHENTKAEVFHHLISESREYESWVDTARLVAGIRWESEIYRQILAADVLVVLIGPGTSESEWVRREIALANALGVSVVPVGFDITDEEMLAETKALSINHLQWTITRNIQLRRGGALLAELDADLRGAAMTTRERQRTIFADLSVRRGAVRDKAPDNQRLASWKIPIRGKRSTALHIATGDIAKLRNIDVLVNSENDYMQMARFFESHTISSILRRLGARVQAGHYQDTIQEELDWRLRERGRPVQAAEVFPTSAGGPDSELSRVNKARVVLHVAAVQAVDAESRVIPYKQPHQIEACVRGALTTMASLSDESGVFSQPGTRQRAEQERAAAAGNGKLTSILFPLFGTGQGGADTKDVIGPMLDGMISYLSERENQSFAETLRDIYVSVYTQQDANIVMTALRERLTSDHG